VGVIAVYDCVYTYRSSGAQGILNICTTCCVAANISSGLVLYQTTSVCFTNTAEYLTTVLMPDIFVMYCFVDSYSVTDIFPNYLEIYQSLPTYCRTFD